ncbi:hypothetical protein Acr_04g0007900 [Actinidia rufa]|uniref:UDP-Glycosyltransferase superfamily protein n=1 Tax=Actinidia rufa TaxID=165716 RepID=A0A7J0EID3_9ERIC|nr:hypothetical protein Acr_04g0007900 [Actinidia rufa]
MVDIAWLFAAQGIHVTIIPTKMKRFETIINRDVTTERHIKLEILPFPSTETDLPEGCENLSITATPEMTIWLFHVINMLQPPIVKVLRESRSDCFFSIGLLEMISELNLA